MDFIRSDLQEVSRHSNCCFNDCPHVLFIRCEAFEMVVSKTFLFVVLLYELLVFIEVFYCYFVVF